MIDIHTHVLPGLDDGAASLEESVEIGRIAAREGTRALVATPHVRDDYPTSAAAMRTALDLVRDAFAAAELPVEVLPGGEIAIDRLELLPDDELRLLALGGGRYVLVEMPYVGWPLDLANRLFGLQVRGFVPVLAHPERNPEVQRSPQLVAPLVEAGALAQVTASSLDGRGGRRAAAAAQALLDAGLVHVVASDAHAPAVREGGLASAAAALRDEALADWLLRAVPEAIVEGARVPPRPEARRRRRWWSRR